MLVLFRSALILSALLVAAPSMASEEEEPGHLTIRVVKLPWYTPRDGVITLGRSVGPDSFSSWSEPLMRGADGVYSITLSSSDHIGHHIGSANFGLDGLSAETDGKGNYLAPRDILIPDTGSRTEDFTIQDWEPYYTQMMQRLTMLLALVMALSTAALYGFFLSRRHKRLARAPVLEESNPANAAALSASVAELKSETKELERWSRVFQK